MEYEWAGVRFNEHECLLLYIAEGTGEGVARATYSMFGTNYGAEHGRF